MSVLIDGHAMPHVSFAGCRALIADQHSSVRTWLRENLSTLGINSVTMAASAIDLVRHLKNTPMPYDVVLCDHHLDPARDGLQLLEELRFQKALPFITIFIIVTSERQYPRVVAAAEFAPDDYLIKPFSPALLEDRLAVSMLRKRHLNLVYQKLDLEDNVGALAACDKVLASSSQFRLDTLRLKAEILVAQGEVEAAAKIYEAVSSTRSVPWARMGYALTQHKQGLLDEAEGIATALNEEHPEFISVYDFLARIREEQGDLAGAAMHLERAAQVATSIDRLRRLAALAEAQDDHVGARAALGKVLERTRKNSMLQVEDYVKMTRSTLASGEIMEAKRQTREMRLEMRNDSRVDTKVAIAVTEALTAKYEERHEDARRHVDTALELHRENEIVNDAMALELANACVLTDKAEEAATLIARVERNLSKEGGKQLNASISALFSKLTSRKTGKGGADSPRGVADDDFEVPELPGEHESRPAKPPSEPFVLPDRGASEPFVLPELSPNEPFVLPELSPNEVETLLQDVTTALDTIEANWNEDAALACRRLLVRVFESAPRERRGIDAHIRYNKIATHHGGQRHKPGSPAQ